MCATHRYASPIAQRTFQRLSHLTGSAEVTDPGSVEAEHTLTKQLATLVVSGGDAETIVSARERVARLLSIAKDMLMEVQYLQDNPEEAAALKGEGGCIKELIAAGDSVDVTGADGSTAGLLGAAFALCSPELARPTHQQAG